MTSNVSVYVLRERLHETWDKREMLKKQEESILRDAIQGLPLADQMIRSGLSLHEQTVNAIVENTQGYETLTNWRNKYLTK